MIESSATGTEGHLPKDKLSMRTDDVAQRIEYATGSKWTPLQYRAVCGILRDYRHYSMMSILDRASNPDEESSDPGAEK